MTVQWLIVIAAVGACIAMAVRMFIKSKKNPCNSCSVRNCCKNPRKK